jgi:Tol biopolymer transport system component
LGRPAWTPDGKNLLVTGVPDDESLSVVRLISLDGSEPRRILEFGEQVAQQTVSPTGRLAFVRRMNDHNIWTVDLPEPTQAGRVNRVIASTYADLNPEFSPDGSKIVFVSSRSGNDEIWVCDRDGGNPVQVTHSGEDGVGSPTWSPNGQFIAYDGYAPPQAPIETSRHYLDWEILISRADGGGEVRRLTSDGGNVLPAWSPDGKWLYYTSIRSTPRRLYRAAVDGDDVELVAEDAVVAMLPPDGKWVYFSRSGQIWRKPAEGGDEQLVVEQFAGSAAVTNEGIYFVAPRSRDDETVISYRDLGTGTTTEVYPTPKRLYAWMDVSADGHRLIFNLLDQQGSDIMIVDDFWR